MTTPRQDRGHAVRDVVAVRPAVARAAARAFAVAMVGLAFSAGWRQFSPIPFWDMWGGVGFYLAVDQLGPMDWWAQHNEHRIVLGRLLFLMDFGLFRGLGVSLVVANFLFAAALAALFWRLAATAAATGDHDRHVAGPLLVGFLFLWTQRENLMWSFQGVFFLAQLLPLMALVLLAGSSGSRTRFAAACVVGALAAGSLANGVLALPAMTLWALLQRQSRRRVAVLAILSVAMLACYFHGYHAPVGHTNVRNVLSARAPQLLQYLCHYLGSPFYYLFGEGEFGREVAAFAGLLFLVLTAASLRSWRRGTPTQALLGCYLAYLLAGAVGTAAGRLDFGIGQAVSLRYTTPALAAWAALAVIGLSTPARPPWRLAGGVAIVLAAAALGYQVSTRARPFDEIWQREVAVLGLELGARDDAQVRRIYPAPDDVYRVADKASAANLAVFALPRLRDLREQLGTAAPVDPPPGGACVGHLDAIAGLPGSPRIARVDGWLFDPAQRRVPSWIRLESGGRIVGFAVPGAARADVAATVDDKAARAGFAGYLLGDADGQPVDAVADGTRCRIR